MKKLLIIAAIIMTVATANAAILTGRILTGRMIGQPTGDLVDGAYLLSDGSVYLTAAGEQYIVVE